MASTDLRNIDANAVVTGFRASGGVLNSVKLTDGQILVGDTGDQPHAATITSDGSISITGGPGTLSLSVARPYNFIFNSDMEIWGSGTSSAPTGWTLSGAGATVAKDVTHVRTGRASAAVTRNGTDCGIFQDISTIYLPLGVWQGVTIILGGWAYATVASRAQLAINDGVTQTNSAFHPGDSAWHFLTVSATTSVGATTIFLGPVISGGDTTASFDAMIATVGSSVSGWVPSGWTGRKAVIAFSVGASTLGANPTYYGLGRADVTALNADYLRPPFKCVARNLRVNSDNGTSTTDLLYDVSAAGATALTATFAAGLSADDTTHEVELITSHGYVIKSTEAAGFRHTAAIEVEEIP